jgi:hypothetical protein
LFVAALFLAVPPASGSDFEQVTDGDAFLRLVEGRGLVRFGIRLEVSPDGTIAGRAFGAVVRGDWQWQDGHSCRRLDFGATTLARNCQRVLVRGDTVRFIADEGLGDSADLTLR